MKVSHSMCGPHEDSEIIFDPVRNFCWHTCFKPLYYKLPVTSILCSFHFHIHLSQHSVTRRKNFLSHPTQQQIKPTPAPHAWLCGYP